MVIRHLAGSLFAILLLAFSVRAQAQPETYDNGSRYRADRDRELAASVRKAEATNPNCTRLRFTGIGVGATPDNLIIAHQQSDLSDHIARNPLFCGPNLFTQTFACRGISFFKDQPAYLLSWTRKWLFVISPIDLEHGRRDASIYIDRSSARCTDHEIPSALLSENLVRFHKLRMSVR